MDLTFFGLTSDLAPQIRINLFNQIHEIVFHGQGGYDWNTIYNMPIWLRRFTFTKIKDFFEKKNEAEEAAMKKARGVQKAKIHKPDIKPSYNAKTSK